MTAGLAQSPFPARFVGRYIEVGKRYLRFREDTPYDAWFEVVMALKAHEQSVQWWLGDALHFGESKYGETYTQALEETDYTYGALRNFAYVSAHVEMSSRDDTLSWSHHRAVAPLEPEEQREVLGQAKRMGWSVSKTREEAGERKTLPPPGLVEKLKEEPQVYEEMRCKCCGALERHWNSDP